MTASCSEASGRFQAMKKQHFWALYENNDRKQTQSW